MEIEINCGKILFKYIGIFIFYGVQFYTYLRVIGVGLRA